MLIDYEDYMKVARRGGTGGKMRDDTNYDEDIEFMLV